MISKYLEREHINGWGRQEQGHRNRHKWGPFEGQLIVDGYNVHRSTESGGTRKDISGSKH